MDPVRDASPSGCGAGQPEAVPVAGITTILQALGDPMRLAIIRSLAAGGGAHSCAAVGLPVTKSTLSHHFRVLREAGVIEQRCEGTRKLTTLRRAELDAAYPGLLDSILRAAVEEPATV